MERCKPHIKIIPVTWIKPPDGQLKLNTDGCSKGNSGPAGGGGCLRVHNGNLIMVYYSFFGSCTNNIAEAKAILIGLKWCFDNGYNEVLVESDSQMLINTINRTTKGPWQIACILEQMKSSHVSFYITSN